MKRKCLPPTCAGRFSLPKSGNLLTLLLLALTTLSAIAQQITGTVSGENGSALPGVNVVVKGSSRGTPPTATVGTPSTPAPVLRWYSAILAIPRRK